MRNVMYKIQSTHHTTRGNAIKDIRDLQIPKPTPAPKEAVVEKPKPYKSIKTGGAIGAPQSKALPPLIKSLYNRPLKIEENKRNQAQRIIAKFGGIGPMARVLREHGWSISPTTIYRWTYDRNDPRYEVNSRGRTRGGKSGHGGVIPGPSFERLVKIARRVGITFTETDFDTRSL